MRTRRFFPCLLAIAGLISGSASAAGFSEQAAENIRDQGKAALAEIQEQQHRAMLLSSRDRLTLAPDVVVPSPAPRVAAQIRLQGKLGLFAIREQLMAEYRTGAAARRLAAQHYRVRGIAAAGAVQSAHSGALDEATRIFKSTKFEWPEFLPSALR